MTQITPPVTHSRMPRTPFRNGQVNVRRPKDDGATLSQSNDTQSGDNSKVFCLESFVTLFHMYRERFHESRRHVQHASTWSKRATERNSHDVASRLCGAKRDIASDTHLVQDRGHFDDQPVSGPFQERPKRPYGGKLCRTFLQ